MLLNTLQGTGRPACPPSTESYQARTSTVLRPGKLGLFQSGFFLGSLNIAHDAKSMETVALGTVFI